MPLKADFSRVEGLKVLEILPQGSQEQPELADLNVVGSVLVVPVELVLGVVKRRVYGRFAVEDLLALEHVTNASVDLGNTGIKVVSRP